MADDDWANWKPNEPSGQGAFKQRVALSRGGSAAPSDSRAGGPPPAPVRQWGGQATTASNAPSAVSRGPLGSRSAAPAPAGGNGRRSPLPDRTSSFARDTRRDRSPPPARGPTSSAAPRSAKDGPAGASADRRTRGFSPDSPDKREARLNGRAASDRKERDRSPANGRDRDTRRGGSDRESKGRPRSRSRDRESRPRDRSRDRTSIKDQEASDRKRDRDIDSRSDRDNKRRTDREGARERHRERSRDRKTDRDDRDRRTRPREEDDTHSLRSSSRRERERDGDRPSKREERDDRPRERERERRREASPDGLDRKRRQRDRDDAYFSPRDRQEQSARRDDNFHKSKRSRTTSPARELAKVKEITPAGTPEPRDAAPAPLDLPVPQDEPLPAAEPEVEADMLASSNEPYLAPGHTDEGIKNKPKVLLQHVAEGTTPSDMQVYCSDFGEVLAVRISDSKDLQNGQGVPFEVTFNTVREAESAASRIDGTDADGSILKATVIRSGLRIKGADQAKLSSAALSAEPLSAPPSASTPTALDPTTAVASPAEPSPSLLSRLGLPIKQKQPKEVNETSKSANGKEAALPLNVLHPYEDLLGRAGVDSLAKLRRLVRPTSVKEYVEALAREYPDEELLKGMTGKWALRERLEEWLGEKLESTLDWGKRPASRR